MIWWVQVTIIIYCFILSLVQRIFSELFELYINLKNQIHVPEDKESHF